MSIASLNAWRAAHFYYHEDRDRLLSQCVLPLIRELISDGLIDRFFFIRYSEGGHHVRLRWLPKRARSQDSIQSRVARHAEDFFARHPSTQTLPNETVLEWDQTNAAGGEDSAANSGEEFEVICDNSWRERKPQFEVDRYGGVGLLPASTDFFNMSSLVALGHVEEFHQTSAGSRITKIWQALASQAIASAESFEDLEAILSYPQISWGATVAPLVESADRAFERSSESYDRLLTAIALHGVEESWAPYPLADGIKRLRVHLDSTTPAVRWRILTSQLHMTANRLGSSNQEEAYLCRMISRALASACGQGGIGHEALAAALESQPDSSAGPLSEVVDRAMSDGLPTNKPAAASSVS